MKTKRKRKKHTEAFKIEAVRLLEGRGDRKVADVAASVGVAESQLHAWKKRAMSGLQRQKRTRQRIPRGNAAGAASGTQSVWSNSQLVQGNAACVARFTSIARCYAFCVMKKLQLSRLERHALKLLSAHEAGHGSSVHQRSYPGFKLQEALSSETDLGSERSSAVARLLQQGLIGRMLGSADAYALTAAGSALAKTLD